MIQINIAQVLIILFALFAFTRVILRLKKQEIRIGEFVFWSLLWIAVIFVALFPDTVSTAAEYVGLWKGLGPVIYGSIIVLFYLVFRLYVKFDNMEQKMSKVVREVSIKNSETKIGKHKK